MNILSEIRSRFRTALAELTDDVDQYLAMVRPAQDPQFGDVQANCAMPLKNKLGKNPREIAADIVARLDVADLCDDPEIAGPGFINLKLRDDFLQQRTNELLNDDRFGVPRPASPKTVVVDFSAPNVAKPMHVGHLRSTVIGAALRNVLNFLGHRVVGDNHIGDWGTQFGMIIFGYKNFRDEAAFAADPVGELARLYRLVSQISGYHETRAKIPALETRLEEKQQAIADAESTAAASDKKAAKALKKRRSELDELKKEINAAQQLVAAVETDDSLHAIAASHPDAAEDARRETAKLHAGDEENLALWNRFLPECLRALNRLYDRLGIEFDETLGESYYQPMLADVVADLQQKGLAVESEGAMCVFNEGFKAPFLVRKSDGAFTYATTDLATIQYRVERLQADEILYVVDSRQSEHFEQLFATARQWGFDATDYRHIKFGTILDKKTRKPYKTRAGDTVGLESLLDEAHARAREVVAANDDAKTDVDGNPTPELDQATRDEVAEAVGIGGIKYADLNHNRESDYAFDWDQMLAREGDTATYMQYAYARVCGIFRKGNVDRDALRSAGEAIRTKHEAERDLALHLCRFAETLEDVVDDYRPNLLTQYLFGLANRFSTFYEKCPVLRSDVADDVRLSRLQLCDLTARTIDAGLSLLGIRTCERM